jgi:hypothetical protein
VAFPTRPPIQSFSPKDARKHRLNSPMTRTMKRVVLILAFVGGLYGANTAGARKDYGDSIYYEAATGLTATDDIPQQQQAASPSEPKTIPEDDNKLLLLEPPEETDSTKTDPRVEQVRLFFCKYKSPAAKYAKLFIAVADENNLDWYLLPAIAFLESGGGKVFPNNNIFGWDSGKFRFSTIEDGIRYVGHALTIGPYARKNTTQKLLVYNVHRRYQTVASMVMGWMKNTRLP